jgi:hypothetical protein
MFIKFLCDGCGHKLKAPPALAGKHAKCTRCSKAVVVPLPMAIPVITRIPQAPAAELCVPAPTTAKIPTVVVAGLAPLKNTVCWFWLGGVVTL